MVARLVTEIIVVLIGIALLVCAYLTDHRWLDRHYLPSLEVPRRVYVLTVWLARAAAAVFGLVLVFFFRPRIGRLAARVRAGRLITDTAAILLAITLALGTCELILRHTFGHAAEERPGDEEPLRRHDARVGWLFVPGRAGHEKIGGRVVEYAFDAAGYRVRRVDEPVDPERPTVVFTGESVMLGYGLNWEESIPAQVQAILGTQCANMAVNGYATDQTYLRLLGELPRFRQPVAVVLIFIPKLFDRNLDQDRPHLGPELVWLPGIYQWRLARVRDIAIPYRSTEAIERAIYVTREVLGAAVKLARERGATPLILMPQFTPEDPTEESLRRRILDEPELPYVLVKLDPRWHVPGDWHPDAHAAHEIAMAIAARLQKH